MNGKSQGIRNDEDLLEQIITQGLNKMKTPPQAMAVEDVPAEEMRSAPRQEDGKETALPADRKNRRSAVYLYLLILFGAAFLMLLLAYFIQQRSSETAISDLRYSMHLSRKELLDEIGDLEERNTALSEELERLNNDLAQGERYKEEAQESINQWSQDYAAVLEDLYSWGSFWKLEQYYQAEDYENCAALLLIQRMSQYIYRTPNAAQDRYAEIVQAVINEGILTEDYPDHISDYEELIDTYLAEHSVYLIPKGC